MSGPETPTRPAPSAGHGSGKGYILVGVLLAIVTVVGAIYGPSQYAIFMVKREVRSMLTDPESAQFRNVEFRKGTVCGEVNARNRFGGYVGFTPFYGFLSSGVTGALVRPAKQQPDDESGLRRMAFDNDWRERCGFALPE